MLNPLGPRPDGASLGTYLALYYTSDGDLAGDTELAAWLAELRGAGAVKGRPDVKALADLSDIATMVIFTASVQHAAVNFPQSSMMSYAPAISGATWGPGPDGTAPSEAAWTAQLPPMNLALEQLQTLWLLGSVFYRPLGDYRTNTLPYLKWFEDPKVTADDGPLAAFQARLQALEEEINARNRERTTPYTYLLPSRVPQSINI